eukprot:GHVT01004539.1.p3 GENE.GHVT01004539.1~~GHVT01004539.1.p3  ORF type:complete len:100 (+),score=3.96 GHVT01004539.1:881-1180(+)
MSTVDEYSSPVEREHAHTDVCVWHNFTSAFFTSTWRLANKSPMLNHKPNISSSLHSPIIPYPPPPPIIQNGCLRPHHQISVHQPRPSSSTNRGCATSSR